MLTIKHFSRITAIPESTLRFYEQQGVLLPAGRTPAGYRLYAPEQILEAKFLYSLRLAAIPIEEVRAFQTGKADPTRRAQSLDRWQRDLDERIRRLTLARRYVETLRSGDQSPIHLQVTERQQIAWFTHDGPVGNFREPIMLRMRQLMDAGVPFDDVYFRWVANLDRPDFIRGQIGFRVSRAPALADAEMEQQPPSLTLSMGHHGPMEQIRDTYRRLDAFMADHGWEACGEAIERYPGSPEWFVEVLVPILYLEGSNPHD